MSATIEQKLILPGGSWDRIQRIIRAYRAAGDEENPTVESIANLAGMQRPLISMNNNFLRSLRLLQEDRNKLTSLGVELATGLEIESEDMVIGSLRRALTESPTTAQLINILRARGPMKLESFRGQIMILAGINQKSASMQWIKSFLDILQEAELIQVNDDTVSIRASRSSPSASPSAPLSVSASPTQSASASPSPSESDSENRQRALATGTSRVPIALGPERLAYIDLPADWNNKKDLGKLLKLLQLSLGDDVDE